MEQLMCARCGVRGTHRADRQCGACDRRDEVEQDVWVTFVHGALSSGNEWFHTETKEKVYPDHVANCYLKKFQERFPYPAKVRESNEERAERLGFALSDVKESDPT